MAGMFVRKTRFDGNILRPVNFKMMESRGGEKRILSFSCFVLARSLPIACWGSRIRRDFIETVR